jgi:hypothetical protein
MATADQSARELSVSGLNADLTLAQWTVGDVALDQDAVRVMYLIQSQRNDTVVMP